MPFITVDSQNEATLLMVHHLHLAAMYFELTHDDHGRHATDVIKKKMEYEQRDAANSFVAVLCSYYEDLGKEEADVR